MIRYWADELYPNPNYEDDERDTDYRYEIFDKDNNLVEDGYVALEAAIEYALENGSEYIKQVYYYLDDEGNIDADDFAVVSSAEYIIERLQILRELHLRPTREEVMRLKTLTTEIAIDNCIRTIRKRCWQEKYGEY